MKLSIALLSVMASAALAAPAPITTTSSAPASQIIIQRARLTEQTVNQYFITTSPIPLSSGSEFTQCPTALGLVNTTPAVDKPGVHVPANVDYPYYLALFSDAVGGLYSIKMDANDWITKSVPTGVLVNASGVEVGTCKADKSGAVTGACLSDQGEQWDAVVWIVCDVTITAAASMAS